jgi:chromosome transmission fidelity protein 4
MLELYRKQLDVSAGATIPSLAFSPTDNLLAWTDSEGNLSRWSKPIPPGFPSGSKPVASKSAAAEKVEGNKARFEELFGDIGEGDIDLGDADEIAAQLEDDEYGDDFVIDDIPRKSGTSHGASGSGLREMGAYLKDIAGHA